MSADRVNQISSRIILALSLFAMLLVVSATILTVLGRFNPSPGGDEGAAAHLFQLAIVLLMPSGFVFLLTADWHHPIRVLKRLVVPAVALGVAFSVLYYLEHLR